MTVFIALQVRHHDCFYYNTGQVFIAIQVRFLLQYRSGFYYNTSQDFITIQIKFLLQYRLGIMTVFIEIHILRVYAQACARSFMCLYFTMLCINFLLLMFCYIILLYSIAVMDFQQAFSLFGW